MMKIGKASRTALRVAIRRAAHQLADDPPVMDDPIAVSLIGPGFARDMERAMHPVARDFRCFMASRSRYAEDNLAKAVATGVGQYVVLGAGLDTFAYRNPFKKLRVFEVDFPATQAWKRGVLEESGIAIPGNVTYVPLDFEHQTLGEGLAEAGFDARKAAFFSWLGVVPYLTLEAFRSTMEMIGGMSPGTAVTFDYVFPPETLSPKRRAVFDLLAGRVKAAGEPFQLFLTAEQVEAEFRRAGFGRTEQVDSEGLNARYFVGRKDGLKLSPVGLGMLATGWV
jgi:methyltransferase (TIGR00027 family)